MKKLIVTLPLSLITCAAFAYPSAPEYTGTLGTLPISIMNAQNTQLQAELLGFQTNVTNTPIGNWQVFGTGISNPIRIQNGNITQPGFKYNSEAFTVGTDYHFTGGLYGVAVGRSMGTLTYNMGNGSATVDENMASFFGGYKTHHFYGTLIATYGNIDDSNISHNIGAQTFGGQTTGEHTGLNSTFGYNFNFMNKKLRTGPLVNINYQNITIKGYAENAQNAGAIAVPIQFGKQDYDSLFTGAGWQVNYATQYNNTQIIPYLQTTYNCQCLNTARSVNVGMGVFSPGTTFATPYNPVNSSFVNVNAGLQTVFSSGLDLTFGYNAAVGQNNVNAQSLMISASMPVM
jgi:uncharacterized protein YhjY with autotransporter beta-barrel domain